MFVVLVSTRGSKTLKSRILAGFFTWIWSISVLLDYVIKLICTPTEEQTGNGRRGSPNNPLLGYSQAHHRGHQPRKGPSAEA